MRCLGPASLALLASLSLAACGSPSDDVAATAPRLGKADSLDRADRSCRVMLRELGRTDEVADGYFVSTATVDVARSLADVVEVGVLYSDNGGPWYAFTGSVASTEGRFERYTVRVDRHTTPTPAMDLRSWEYQRASVAVYVKLSDGTRLFDHNRVSSDFANYELSVSNDFAVARADGICPVQPPRAELSFRADFSTVQRGPLVPGGTVTLDYALDRLPACRWSRAGYQLWDIEANVKFQPQGILVTRTVTQIAGSGSGGGGRVSVPTTVEIPLGTQRVDVWFRNYSAANTCETFDSAYGANYQFPVEALGAPIGWAGDWGGSFSRACEHQAGLAEPISIDEYVRERACKLIDADVYVPGLTDGTVAHPERLWAEVEWAIDGAAQAAVPLQFQGRVGNNFRYRWQLPYELMMSTWSDASFAFRFSHDGNTWFRIGQSAGPDGGAARTILRAF